MVAAALLLAAQIPPGLERLAEEAEVFAQAATKVVGEETLRQRALKPPPRFRPRIGQSALAEPKPEYREREIHSEFGYASIGGQWHEARQVESVDGRTVAQRGKARTKLAMGIRSDDDLVKRRLLEDLERHGLEGSATDFTLTLLLFRASNLQKYRWKKLGEERLGVDATVVFEFDQIAGEEAFTIFDKREALRSALKGRIWLRKKDGVPIKIEFAAMTPADEKAEDRTPLIDIARVEYMPSPSGTLLPVAALHRRSRGRLLIAENNFSYGNFKRFSTDSEIKFTPVDEEPPPAPATPAPKP